MPSPQIMGILIQLHTRTTKVIHLVVDGSQSAVDMDPHTRCSGLPCHHQLRKEAMVNLRTIINRLQFRILDMQLTSLARITVSIPILLAGMATNH